MKSKLLFAILLFILALLLIDFYVLITLDSPDAYPKTTQTQQQTTVEKSIITVPGQKIEESTIIEEPIKTKDTEEKIDSMGDNKNNIPVIKEQEDNLKNLTKTDNVSFNIRCLNYECQLLNNLDYIIITRPLFLESLNEFVKWKEENNFRTGIITVDWTVDNFYGLNVVDKIKNMIYYFKDYQNVKYFLIVGDTRIDFLHGTENTVGKDEGWFEPTSMFNLTKEWNVPTGYFLMGYRPNVSWMGFSDLYYADREPLPVDSEGHRYYSWDDTKLYFDYEAIIGRWPVRTPEEVISITKKTKKFKPTTSKILGLFNTEFNLEDPCTDWKEPDLENLSLSANTFCYSNNVFSVKRAINEIDISYNYYIFNLSENEEREKAQKFIFETDAIVLGTYHGQLYWNELLRKEDIEKFEKIIPLYSVDSCQVTLYYIGEIDTLAEAMLKAENGPVVIHSNPDKYFFFKLLTKGYSVGEASLSNLTVNRGLPSHHDLIGDPSLVLFEK